MAQQMATAGRVKGSLTVPQRLIVAPACFLRRFSQPSIPRHSKPEHRHFKAGIPIVVPAPARVSATLVLERVRVEQGADANPLTFHGVHHVGLLCENLEKSLEFYQGLLGLTINPDRPDDKLPYRGAWLWIGPEMIHLMELPNPDPLEDRPQHGGRDRHVCVGITNLEPLLAKLDESGITYTRSKSGRPAVFFRDPDMNCLEVVETVPWRE